MQACKSKLQTFVLLLLSTVTLIPFSNIHPQWDRKQSKEKFCAYLKGIADRPAGCSATFNRLESVLSHSIQSPSAIQEGSWGFSDLPVGVFDPWLA